MNPNFALPTRSYSFSTGYTWFRFCAEGSTTATTEASDPTACPCGNSDTMPVEMLRC